MGNINNANLVPVKNICKKKEQLWLDDGGQLKENVWKENVAQTLPEGPVEKRLYQARATVSRLLGYGKWGPVDCKQK